MTEKMLITKYIERLYYIFERILSFFAYIPFRINHLRVGRIKKLIYVPLEIIYFTCLLSVIF